MEEGTKAKRTVYIGGIGEEIDQKAIFDSFSTFGDIVDVQIPPAQENFHHTDAPLKHRGFAFVTYTAPGDAQDAIDNMDMNVLSGRVLRVSLAKPQRMTAAASGNRAIWESEEWLKQYAKPLAQSGGVGARAAKADSGSAEPEEQNGGEDAADAMEE